MSSPDSPTPAPGGSPPEIKACCNFASITQCHADGLGGTDLRRCHQCGENGMHHHFCATDEKTAHAASDPGGPGTSLCAVCSGLLSDEVDDVDERHKAGVEAGVETESANAPVVDGPADEVQADKVDRSTAAPTAPDDLEQPAADVFEACDDTKGIASSCLSYTIVCLTLCILPHSPVHVGVFITSYTAPFSGVVADAAPEQPFSDEQDFQDANMGENANSIPSAEVFTQGSGDAGLTASVIQCDRRIRVAQRPDDGPCTGLVFGLAGRRAIICFDDKLWESYNLEELCSTAKMLLCDDDEGGRDVHAVHLGAVLLGKKGASRATRMPAGFLYGCLPECCMNNWEVYRLFDVPPVLSDAAFSDVAARYAAPCLCEKLMAGECVELDKTVQFVPAVTGSAAAGGKLSKEFPCRAWVCAFLLGGVWNNTKGRIDKRRWALLLLFKKSAPENTELHLVPFESFNFKEIVSAVEYPSANVELLIDRFIRERTPSAINSAFAAIVRVQSQPGRTTAAAAAADTPGPRTPVTRGANRAAAGATNVEQAAITSTTAGAGTCGSTALKVPMDLTGYGPSRLMKESTPKMKLIYGGTAICYSAVGSG
eukprot:6183159-Pleurochrysis_carterae.AAC.1